MKVRKESDEMQGSSRRSKRWCPYSSESSGHISLGLVSGVGERMYSGVRGRIEIDELVGNGVWGCEGGSELSG